MKRAGYRVQPWPPPSSKRALNYRSTGEIGPVCEHHHYQRQCSALFDTVVLVVVGPQKKKYYIHKALLVHHSEYFRKALQGSWKEAPEGVVELEDIDHCACKSCDHVTRGDSRCTRALLIVPSQPVRGMAIHPKAARRR